APHFFQTPPRGGPRPCAFLVLHLHQVAQRTYTSKLLNMPGTRRAAQRAGPQLSCRARSSASRTVVYVTHDQMITVISAGRICQLATPDEIYERPQTAFVAGFLGRSNFFEVTPASAGAMGSIVAAGASGARLQGAVAGRDCGRGGADGHPTGGRRY